MSTEVATELEQRIADSVNAERSAEGLEDVKIEAHLNSSAQAHSDWMADNEEFSHEGENGSNVAERIESAEFPLTGAWRTSENLAATSILGELDAGEIDRMHEGLMDSPGHRANILDPDVSYIGVGLAVGTRNVNGFDQNVAYLTQNFAETSGEVLVQTEDSSGSAVLQPHQNGQPIGDASEVAVPSDENVDEVRDFSAPEEVAETAENEASDGSNACFVATAAYGDRAHPDVIALKEFRDKLLVRHWLGRAFVRFYWTVGPLLARGVAPDGTSGQVMRTVISPLARLAAWQTARRK